MRRNIEQLIKRIREELRAEGPDGAGFSDFLIMDAMNSAMEDMAEVFPIRDKITFNTEADKHTYDSEINFDNLLIIGKVEYDGKPLTNIAVADYVKITEKSEGEVDRWVMWGNAVTLIGDVEAGKVVTLWITRSPAKLEDKGDTPELPAYADEAIIAYALSVCHRESKDYDRADYHYGIYLRQKDSVLKRAVPQGHRAGMTRMNDSYWGSFQAVKSSVRSDTNPGGN